VLRASGALPPFGRLAPPAARAAQSRIIPRRIAFCTSGFTPTARPDPWRPSETGALSVRSGLFPTLAPRLACASQQTGHLMARGGGKPVQRSSRHKSHCIAATAIRLSAPWLSPMRIRSFAHIESNWS